MSNKSTTVMTEMMINFIKDIIPTGTLSGGTSKKTAIEIQKNNPFKNDKIIINGINFCEIGHGEVVFNSLDNDGKRKAIKYSKMAEVIENPDNKHGEVRKLIATEFLINYNNQMLLKTQKLIELDLKLQATQVNKNIQNNILTTLEETGKILAKENNSSEEIKTVSDTLQGVKKQNGLVKKSIQKNQQPLMMKLAEVTGNAIGNILANNPSIINKMQESFVEKLADNKSKDTILQKSTLQ